MALAKELNLPKPDATALSEANDLGKIRLFTAVIANEFSLDITAGVASLGRNSDVQALIQAAQVIGGVVPVLTQLSQRIDPERIIDMVFRSYNLDTSLVMRTPEELNQLNEMQQQVVNQADPLAAVQATGEL